MREASTALGFGRGVQLVQRSRKSGGFLLREHTGQVLVKGRFHLGFGGFQVLGLFGGEQQLAAPVVGGVLPGEVALSFQIFCAARNGGLVRVQKLGQLCLGAAGVVAQCMDQVDLRRADSLFPYGEQDQLFRFPRDLCDFSLGDVNRCLPCLVERCIYIVVGATIIAQFWADASPLLFLPGQAL